MPGAALRYLPGGLDVNPGGAAITVQLPPRLARGRLKGLLFDTDKTFLLPRSLHGIRALKRFFDRNPQQQVLVVGHADTAGGPQHNLKLSEERAASIAAYLRDEVEIWMQFYAGSRPGSLRWGTVEDQNMLSALSDGSGAFYTGPIDGQAGSGTRRAFQRFQRSRGLPDSGQADDATRRALVTAYMQLPGTTLPAGTTLQTHGCGESHPEVATGDSVHEQRNRRVEIFFFDGPIDPPPQTPCPSGGCPEQPQWVRRARPTFDLEGGLGALVVTVRDGAGQPVPEAEVHASGPSPADGRTGDDGVVRFPDLVPGSYTVDARRPSFRDGSTSAVIPPGDGDDPPDTPAQVVLQADQGELNVQVRDAAGPVAGASVTVEVPIPGNSLQGATDASGNAVFPAVPAGDRNVRVTAPGHDPGQGTAHVQAGASSSTTITIAAQRGALAVTVRSSQGPAISGAAVRVQNGPPPATTDGSGVATFPSLPPGPVQFTVEHAGFNSGQGAATVANGATTGATVTLTPSIGDLAVRVQDSLGRPLRGAQVRLQGPLTTSAQSSAAGSAQFGNLPVGDYQVTGTLDPDFGSSAPVGLTISGPGASTTITLTANAVTPQVVAPAMVVVKKDPAAPARKQVTLRTTAPFGGRGKLTVSSDALRLFRDAATPTPLAFDDVANVFPGSALQGGVTLFVEGARPEQGVELRLALESGGQPFGTPGGAQVTSVEVTVDAQGAGNVDIPRARLVADGVFVQLADGAGHGTRIKALVRRAAPAGVNATLRLQALDAKVRCFDAPAGGAAVALPLVLAPADIPAAGKEVWIEGAAVSGALKDTGLRLGVDAVEPDGDRLRVTVAAFDRMQATIHPSPQLHARVGFPAPTDHVFPSTSLDEDFARNRPLVLFRNAQPDVALQVTARPANLPLRWRTFRDAADHASLGDANHVPAVTAGASADRATLQCNEKGSFHVRAFLDTNGDANWQAGEPFIALNLVLADATLVTDRSAAHQANLVSGATGGGGFQVRNGVFGAGGGAAGMEMDLDIDVTGGGADGRLGLDRAFGGLINDLAFVDIHADYRDGGGAIHALRNVYVSNVPANVDPTLGRPTFRPVDPAPNPLDWPVLDSGRPSPGLGGNSATMSSSAFTRAARPVGQRWNITCLDSPGRSFPGTHPLIAGANLVRVHYTQRFVANFCLWTNLAANIGTTGDPADRVYCVIRIVPWAVQGEWTLGGGPPAVVTAHTIGSGPPATVNPIGRAQDNNVEVRAPSGIGQAFAWDARS